MKTKKSKAIPRNLLTELGSSGFTASRVLNQMLAELGSKKFVVELREEFKRDPKLKRYILFSETFDRDIKMLRLLIEAGADVRAKHESGATPLLDYAAVPMSEQEDAHLECCKILINAGADVNTKHTLVSLVTKRVAVDQTALMIAASNGSLKIVRLLLASGADILAKNGLGFTAIDIARKYNHLNVVRELEKLEAKQKA